MKVVGRSAGFVAILLSIALLVLIFVHPLGYLYARILDARISQYRESATGPLVLGADLGLAGHSSGLVLPLDVKLKQLQVLNLAGVEVIRLTLAYDPWLCATSTNDSIRAWGSQKIAEVDELVRVIREKGHKLMIADAGAETYWSQPLSWGDFSTAYLARVKNLTARYKPDYYIVTKEPAWYAGIGWGRVAGGMIADAVTPAMWIDLLKECVKFIDGISPETRIAVAVIPTFPESQEFFRAASKLEGVDILGIDVYKLDDLNETFRLASSVPIGKEVWILETWDGNPDRQINQPWRKNTHAKWITLMGCAARSHGIKGMVIFYSRRLSYLKDPRSVDGIRDALEGRTPAFHAFRELVKEAQS